MPQFLREFLHGLIAILMKTVVRLTPSDVRHTSFVGDNSAGQLCRHILRTGASKVLVVTDKPLRELGVVDRAVADLVAGGADVAYYDGVLPDPTFDQVAEGARQARAHDADAILAIGGGSSMDAAKIIAASATSDESPVDWVGFGKVKHDILKLYAIPTTSGTGSEATMGAVISDPVSHEKSIISGGVLLPLAVALDPELLAGLPPHITAATGMDALTHAIEAYIGTWERGTRKEDSRVAVRLIFDNLAQACKDGSDMEARYGMAMGAYYAGIAINQVNVGNVHAIAHQLGGKYGIPHGLANALVLPHVLEFCREEAEKELAELAVLVGAGEAGEGDAVLSQKFIKVVRDLRTEVGISDTSEKIKREDFGAITQLALAEGMGYFSPRLLDKASVQAILSNIAG